MYTGSPTIFNVPEITTLRRVKPLPKRRRTSAHGLSSSTLSLSIGSTVSIMPSPPGGPATAVVASTASLIGDADLEAAANALLAPPQQQQSQSQPLALTTQVQSLSASLLPSSSTTSTRTAAPQQQQPAQLAVNSDPGDNNLLLPGTCNDAEELLAHADSLSARMALQSYYMPMLGSMQEFLAAAAASAGISAGEMFKDRLGGTTTAAAANCATGDGMGPYVDLDSAEFLYGPGTAGYHGMSMGIGFGGLSMGMGVGTGIGGGHHEDDESHGDGDYVDHLQQPGNTKKRKVPANVSVSQRDDAESSDHTQDEGEERGVPFGRAVDYDDLESSASALDRLGYQHPNYGCHQVSPHASMVPTLYHGARRGKLTAATLAGLQHKEMLKARKRQLAAVLGALSHGDTLALDQALSMSYVYTGAERPAPKIRLSKRKVVRTARMKENGKENQRKQKFPACEFTFMCPSATADRLIATKAEVKVLRKKFEAELERQAEHLAAANNLIKAGSDEGLVRQPLAQVMHPQQLSAMTSATIAKGPKGKKGRAKSAKNIAAPEPAALVTPTPTGAKSREKKKKRSALANESNPHHLRNYVPLRLAQSSSHNASSGHSSQQQQQSWISPLPVRFLSAEIPPRRRPKNGELVAPLTTQVPLKEPGDEWICAFCEYDLFYGDDAGLRRAVKNRKKILRRRRRARERAAAAASGRVASVPVTNVPAPPPNAGGNISPVPVAPVSQKCSSTVSGPALSAHG